MQISITCHHFLQQKGIWKKLSIRLNCTIKECVDVEADKLIRADAVNINNLFELIGINEI